jgi:hypothetical protein
MNEMTIIEMQVTGSDGLEQNEIEPQAENDWLAEINFARYGY